MLIGLLADQSSIIAITGLGGHAYGSWKGRGTLGQMWLRHFLAKDLPHCRTMIYGYDAALKSFDIASLRHYSQRFLLSLQHVRSTEEEVDRLARPMFVAKLTIYALDNAPTFLCRT